MERSGWKPLEDVLELLGGDIPGGCLIASRREIPGGCVRAFRRVIPVGCVKAFMKEIPGGCVSTFQQIVALKNNTLPIHVSCTAED